MQQPRHTCRGVSGVVEVDDVRVGVRHDRLVRRQLQRRPRLLGERALKQLEHDLGHVYPPQLRASTCRSRSAWIVACCLFFPQPDQHAGPSPRHYGVCQTPRSALPVLCAHHSISSHCLEGIFLTHDAPRSFSHNSRPVQSEQQMTRRRVAHNSTPSDSCARCRALCWAARRSAGRRPRGTMPSHMRRQAGSPRPGTTAAN